MASTFDRLVDEAAAAPMIGWDFSWLDGRATEARPSWGYARLAAGRVATADVAVDIDTGGGEVLAEIVTNARLGGRLGTGPVRVVATESTAINLAVAAAKLHPLGVAVVAADDSEIGLPFCSDVFDLAISRHPVDTGWTEVARVLRPGGTFLAQEIGTDSNRELYEALVGPLPPGEKRSPEGSAREARAAGLTVVDLRAESLPMVFYDIGAVVWFLRKVVWTIPGFTVEEFRPRLRELHQRIAAEGSFTSHAQRFLIEARKAG